MSELVRTEALGAPDLGTAMRVRALRFGDLLGRALLARGGAYYRSSALRRGDMSVCGWTVGEIPDNQGSRGAGTLL